MNITSLSTLSQIEKEHVESIVEKIEKQKSINICRITSFDKMYSLLTKSEIEFIKKLLKINVRTYGFKGAYYGIHDVPLDLVEIVDQKYKIKSKVITIDKQFLPRIVFTAYTKLNESLWKERGMKLLIESGYRSPAYQLFVFIWYLRFYKFNLIKTFKRAAIPGYSEHGFTERQAIDFMTENGIPYEENPTDFENTIEYRWLLMNANKFHFYLSYPRGNKIGTMFEPWHWAYVK